MPSRLHNSPPWPCRAWLPSLTLCGLAMGLAGCDPTSHCAGDNCSESWSGRVLVRGRTSGVSALFRPLMTASTVTPSQVKICTPQGSAPSSCVNQYLIEETDSSPLTFVAERNLGSIEEYDNSGCTIAGLSALKFKRADFHPDARQKDAGGLYANASMEDVPEKKCGITLAVKLWDDSDKTPIPEGVDIDVNGARIPLPPEAPSHQYPPVSKELRMRLKVNLPLGWDLVRWRMDRAYGPPLSICEGLDTCSFSEFGGTVTALIARSGECDDTNGDGKAQICREVDRRGIRGLWGSAGGTEYWAVGRNRTIVHVRNGLEVADKRIDTLGPITLRSVWGYAVGSTAELFAVGEEGAVLNYSNGNWAAEISTTSEPLFSVFGNPSGSLVFAVGANGSFLRRDKGGWARVKAMSGGVELPLAGINLYAGAFAADGSRAFVAGDNGILLCYNCNGAEPRDTWTLPPTNPDRNNGLKQREFRGVFLGSKYLWLLASPTDATGKDSTLFQIDADNLASGWIPGIPIPSLRATGLHGVSDRGGDELYVVGERAIFTYATRNNRKDRRFSLPSMFLSPISNQLWTVFSTGADKATLIGGDPGVLRVKLPLSSAGLLGLSTAAGDLVHLTREWPR